MIAVYPNLRPYKRSMDIAIYVSVPRSLNPVVFGFVFKNNCTLIIIMCNNNSDNISNTNAHGRQTICKRKRRGHAFMLCCPGLPL